MFCIFQEARPPYDISTHVMVLGLCDYWNNSLSLVLVTSPALTGSSWKADTVSCLL